MSMRNARQKTIGKYRVFYADISGVAGKPMHEIKVFRNGLLQEGTFYRSRDKAVRIYHKLNKVKTIEKWLRNSLTDKEMHQLRLTYP